MADDLIKEVEEEQRRQQLEALWKKYRVLIIGTVVAALAGVGGYEGWRYWQADQKEAAAVAFGQAAKIFARGEGSEKEAAGAFAKVADTFGGGYGMVARMQEAAARSIAGETDNAIALYDALSKGAAGGDLFAEYARLRAGMLEAETVPFPKLKERLAPVANGQGPWRFLAQELLAFSAWRSGDTKSATTALDKIDADPAASEAVRLRAESMKQLIASGISYADVKAAAPAAPAPAVTPMPSPVSPPTPATPPGAPAAGPAASPPSASSPATPPQGN